jgi:hypothetical protein
MINPSTCGDFPMPIDKSYIELNRASTNRMRKMSMSLTDEQLRQIVNKDWTVYSTYAHLNFWDIRVMQLLDLTKREGKLTAPQIDEAVNDILNVMFLAIPPRLAVQMAFQSAGALDEMIENFPPDLLEQIHAQYKRWVFRAYHRNAHLDKIEAALKI